MKSTFKLYAGIGLFLLCTTLGARRHDRTLGAIVGGTVGGVIGALSSDDPGKGAAHGLLWGATTGSIIAGDDDYFYCDLSYHELVEEFRKVKRNNKKQAHRIGVFRNEIRNLKNRVKNLKKENKSLSKRIRRL